MNLKTILTAGLLTFGPWLAVSSGQHHHDHHDHHDRHGHHEPRHGHHGLRLFVVPPAVHYGSYYTQGDVHYYTPPPVVGRPQVAQPPAPVAFGGFKHYDQLAQRLDTVANQLCLDLHHNYAHNRNFQESYREAYQLLKAARYLHGSEHRGDRNALRRSIRDIDNLFHHVQGEVKTWSRAERRQVGRLGIGAKLEEMEAIIHHLAFDLGVKPDHDRDEDAPPPDEEIAPPPATIEGLPPLPPGGP